MPGTLLPGTLLPGTLLPWTLLPWTLLPWTVLPWGRLTGTALHGETAVLAPRLTATDAVAHRAGHCLLAVLRVQILALRVLAGAELGQAIT